MQKNRLFVAHYVFYVYNVYICRYKHIYDNTFEECCLHPCISNVKITFFCFFFYFVNCDRR